MNTKGLLCLSALLVVLTVTAAQRNENQFTAPGCGLNSRPVGSDECAPKNQKTCGITEQNDVEPSDADEIKCQKGCICYEGYVWRTEFGTDCIEPSACEEN
ncbi:hypothetical protein DMENIID0001_110980 [Sergentomyia squamirostris]